MAQPMTILEWIREFLILIRIQQVGTSVTPIIGALSVKGSGLELSTAALLFLVAAIFNIGGQVHNDLCDYNVDKQSTDLQRRPLVNGTFSLRSAKIIVLANLALILAILLYFFPSIYATPTILTGFLAGTLYNVYSKRLPGADLFLSVSMAMFFLFGAIVATDNFQGFQDISMTTWVLFGLVLIHVFLMDALGGGLKDAENDRKSGAKTLAVSLGVRVNKEFIISLSYKIIILLFECSTVILTAILYIIIERNYQLIQLILVILILIGMVTSTLRLLSMKEFNRKKIKYVNRNHELFGYMLVPMILINTTGVIWFLFLLIFPILWFMVFNYILYHDSWRNPKTF